MSRHSGTRKTIALPSLSRRPLCSTPNPPPLHPLRADSTLRSAFTSLAWFCLLSQSISNNTSPVGASKRFFRLKGSITGASWIVLRKKTDEKKSYRKKWQVWGQCSLLASWWCSCSLTDGWECEVRKGAGCKRHSEWNTRVFDKAESTAGLRFKAQTLIELENDLFLRQAIFTVTTATTS